MAGRGFQKGQKRPANAGRKKGTPNKVTLDALQTLKDMGHDPAAEHVKIFLEAKDRYQKKIKQKNEWGANGALEAMRAANADLMKYVYPVRKAVEHTGAEGGPIKFQTYNDIVKAIGGVIEDDDDNDDAAEKS